MYGEHASLASTAIAPLAKLDTTGYSLVATGLLKGAGFLARLVKVKTKSLEQLKQEIIADLRAFGELQTDARFFVVIDDLDRLEPEEAVEVLRLIRKVANFPLVTYLVCFDQRILSRHIRKSIGVDGNDFIEKIFQNVISVPPQEAFALRRYLQKLLGEVFPGDLARTDSARPELETRKQYLFDTWAGRLLETPRDVVRVTDAIVFGWPHIAQGADFFDFVWLQLVKLKAPRLYLWVQNYVREVGAYRDGGTVDRASAKRQGTELEQILRNLHWIGDEVLRSGIDTFLPGLKTFAFGKDEASVFNFETADFAILEEGKRLGSPSHWRRYFAFDKPTYAIDDDEVLAFRKMAGSNYLEAARFLKDLFAKPDRKRGYRVRVLLERLAALPDQSISAEEASGTAAAFASVMDSLAHRREKDEFGENAIWRLAAKILKRDDPDNFANLVRTGASENWLAYVLRQEEVAGNRQDGWLSTVQFHDAVSLLVARFKLLESGIFEKPEPLQILFCWLQLGDSDEVRSFIAEATKSDEGFLNGLDALRGWSDSSVRGVYFPLYKQFVAHFMDDEMALMRLKKLAGTEGSEQILHEKAKELLEEWSEQNLP